MSVLAQWASEIRAHIKGMSVYTHYGSEKKELSLHTLKTSDVVLTTYGTLSAEAQRPGVARRQGTASCGGVGGVWSSMKLTL